MIWSAGPLGQALGTSGFSTSRIWKSQFARTLLIPSPMNGKAPGTGRASTFATQLNRDRLYEWTLDLVLRFKSVTLLVTLATLFCGHDRGCNSHFGLGQSRRIARCT